MIPVKKQHRYIAEFDAVVRPSVKIVEVPYMKISAFVVDSPPMPPDINIVPYLHVNNKINIFMNNGVGKKKARTNIYKFRSWRAQRLENMTISKGLGPGRQLHMNLMIDRLILMVFRTTNKPSSYADFNGKLHKSIDVAQEMIPLTQNPKARKGKITTPLSSIAFK